MPYRTDSFLKLTDAGFVLNGSTANEPSSRTEPKGGNEWLGDATEQGPSSNKKQAVEDVTIIPSVQGASLADYTMHINDQPVAAKVQGNITPFGSTNDMKRETKGLTVQGSEHNPPESLLVSHWDKNPSFGCIEELRASLVKASNDSMSLTKANSSPMGGCGINTYNDSSSLSVPPFIDMDGSNLSDDFSLPGENFMRSMVATFNKEYGDNLIRQTTHEKADEDVTPVLPSRSSELVLNYENADGSVYIPVVDPSYEPGLFTLIGHSFQQESGSFLSMTSSYSEEDNTPKPTAETYDEQISDQPDNAANKNVSFGGFQEGPAVNSSGGNFISCEQLNRNQNPVQGSVVYTWNSMAGSRAYPIVTTVVPINPDPAETPKMRRPAKARDIATIGFPANVKSLLSTGIFDGVPVKYVSWSREKRLRGIVSGTSYICSCKDCNNVQKVTAYEFEQHAGCRTKHPNNHIYFDNGKTVYAVVLELRKTPPDMLFDKIQTATGSPINEENFQAWKAREFKRISKEIEASMPWRGLQG